MTNAAIDFCQKWSVRGLAVFLATLFCLGGCGDSMQLTGASALQGQVFGGQQPIVGSAVYVFSSSGQTFAPPSFLGKAITDSSGGFNLVSFNTTPSSGDLIYAAALGGDAGSGSTNANISLLGVIGLYGSASSNLQINELTTVASATQLNPFMVQVPCSTLTGQAQADDGPLCPQINGLVTGWNPVMSKISALIDPSSGTLTTSDANDVQSINLQASVLANCVNSAGGSAGDPTPCGNLMSNPNSPFAALSAVSVQGYGTFNMAMSPDGRALYVTNQTRYGVASLQSDHGALTWISEVIFSALDSYPTGIAISPDGHDVAVMSGPSQFAGLQSSNAGLLPVNTTVSDSVFRLSGVLLQYAVFSKDGSQLFMIDFSGGSIISCTFSNGQPLLSSINFVQAGSEPWALALSPDGLYLYVSDLVDNTITVYATSSGTLTPINGTLAASRFATGVRPYALAVSPNGQYVYVANSPTSGSGSISVFSSHAGQLTPVGLPVATGGTLRAIAASPDGQYLALSIASPLIGFYIYQVNAGQLTLFKSVTTNRSPRDLKFSPNGQYLYATVPGPINSAQGYILTYTTQSQAASDTLSALLNLHAVPTAGATRINSLWPSQPVFTPIPASQPATLVIS